MATRFSSMESEKKTSIKCPNCRGKMRLININRSYYANVETEDKTVYGYEDLQSQRFFRICESNKNYLLMCSSCIYAISYVLFGNK